MTRDRRKDAELEAIVLDALRSLDWMVPESETEVLRSEKLQPLPLPDRLSDPYELLDQGAPPVARATNETAKEEDPEIQRALARAAREATQPIPEEIEDRMKKHRKRAETYRGTGE